MAGTALKTLVALLGCLVAADIVGVIACTLFDVTPMRGSSAALAYAIWLVLGIFCGLFAYNMAGAWSSPIGGKGDWTTQPGAGRIGTQIVIVGAALLVGLTIFFYQIYWSQGVAGEYYVPDSASHSIVFFGAVQVAMVMGRFMLMPTPPPPQ